MKSRHFLWFGLQTGNPWPWVNDRSRIFRVTFTWRKRIHHLIDYTETGFYRDKPLCKRLTLWKWRVFEINPQFSGRARV